ncbi:tetratricopeptide repeat protein, partial [Ideonella sp.]|uniref:tetratricopeptide repeat protein n=1 Tax=Ideonella sp. TaxID=1929293 RepID=UPI003BB60498
TRAGHRPATPGYAAPEQLVGGPITVATDVYALGLMLFELLCGQAPPQVESARLGQAPMPADWQAELPRPSASVDAAAAEQMGLSLRAAQRALAGDLDAIVAQATRTDPRERYDSVAQLAADLGRHGRGQPIRARRITAWQRAAKFVRRHRSATALSALLFFSLVAGISGVLWQAHQAQAQARRAEAVKQFLLGVFKASDPRMASDTPRGQITAKALLDASAGQIEAHFSGDPELQIELLRTAADIYRELGEDEAYDRYQARQIALARQHFGPLHENVLEGMVEAAVQAFEQGDSAACRRLLDEVDPLLRQAGQDDSELRGTWWSQRAVCLRELPDAAADREVALQQSLRLFEKHAPLSRGHVTAWAELATERTNAGRFADGVAAQREVIALAQRVPDRNEAELQTLYSNLGVALLQLGDLAGAEQAFAQSAEIAERTSGATSRKAWVPAGKRARTAHLAGQRERAQQWFTEVIAVLPPGDLADADALMVREDYGERLAAEGRPLAAIPWLEGVERQWRTSAPQDFALRRVRRSLGDAYDRAGRSGDARRVLNQALVDYEAHSPASSQTVIAMRERWGRFLLDQGEAAAARGQFEQAVRDAATPTWSHVALAQAGLARLALAAGDMDQARALSAQALKT